MSRDQTAHAAAVADLGLERGVRGSKARHTRVKAFYEALGHPPVQPVTIKPEALKRRTYPPSGWAEKVGLTKRIESTADVAARITEDTRRAYAPALDAAAGARELRKKAKQADDTVRFARQKIANVIEAAGPYLEAIRPLNPRNRAILAEQVKAISERLQGQQQDQKSRQQAAPEHGYGRGLG